MILGVFIAVLNYINYFQKSDAINVALGKECTFCDKKAVSPIVTNGIRHDITPETISLRCNPNAYIDVNLIDKYHIQRVWLKTGGNQFDYFVVKLLISRYYELCSEYPQRAAGNDWVVCQYQRASDKVRLETRHDNGMVLYEIEVHAEGDNNREEIFHEGCYTVFEGVQKSATDVYQCRKMCVSTHTYFGMKNRTKCFCGESVYMDKEVSSFKCFLCASNATLRCGSETTFSVYKTENRRSHYLGCFPIEDIYTDFASVSLTDCMRSCPLWQYMIIREGHACKCVFDHEALRGRSAYTRCNIHCRGQRILYCGGSRAISVYKTCHYGSHSLSCDNVYHCSNFTPLGYCTTCHRGYTGFGCVHRISDKDGCWIENVCVDQPNSYCKDEGNSYICQCRENHKRFEENGLCEEDKCMLNFCVNQPHTECARINGSFHCICTKGFVKNNTGHCEEENVCLINNLCAGQFNAECAKVSGFFQCVCITGYTRDENRLCIESCPTNLCVNKNNTKCVKRGSSFECICLEGYSEDVKGACIARVTLCPPNHCVNYSNTECDKVRGRYVCICLEGYSRYEDGHCHDDDECIDHPCDNRTSTCTNLDGSYFCPCRPNFIPVTHLVCIRNGTDYFTETEDSYKILFIVLPIVSIFCFCLIAVLVAKFVERSSSSRGSIF